MLSSIVLGSTSSLLNIVLGAIEPVHLVVANLSRIRLEITGLGAVVITTLSKQRDQPLGIRPKVLRVTQVDRTELVLSRMSDSSYASSTDFIETCAAELNRIEESAPAVPDYVFKRLGATCTYSPVSFPPRQDLTVSRRKTFSVEQQLGHHVLHLRARRRRRLPCHQGEAKGPSFDDGQV